ncbi:hypothetical protein K458DRAFT_421432 [Lentithecium fluviatile CBS 122367]|uniref:Uncharacterized protein n=1 Tax=Lentithecium fluviatile CBS 122367 TaxID=1168545 RepID=A0A6G1IQR5_9PLEO|nr:hypothetical protein K458DRAFT_421432 [Lentithecium fluviatile CBS 122367]
MPLSTGMDCTSKSDVACTIAVKQNEISISGVDVSSIAAAFDGTSTYSGAEVAFATASVTAGADKLASAGSSGSATPAASANGTVSGSASPSPSAPAEQTGAASAFGVEVAALFGIGAAAAAQFL